jgi:hypothetical protein
MNPSAVLFPNNGAAMAIPFAGWLQTFGAEKPSLLLKLRVGQSEFW